MPATIFNGKYEANLILARIGDEIVGFKSNPQLAIVMVGDDARSEAYIARKQAAAQSVGIDVKIVRLPAQTKSILAEISRLNSDATVHGIILQLPVPGGVDAYLLLAAIDHRKDVDGLCPENQGRLALELPGHVPATVRAVLLALKSSGTNLAGSSVCLVGHGILVGRPLGVLLPTMGATVSICTEQTSNLSDHTQQADIIISAAGRAGLISPKMVKPGAVVIDIGISVIEGKLVGDVEPKVAEIARFLTPSVGGIGPVTVAMLMQNTVNAYKILNHNE